MVVDFMSTTPAARQSKFGKIKAKVSKWSRKKVIGISLLIIFGCAAIIIAVVVVSTQTGSGVFSAPVAYNAAPGGDDTLIPNADVSFQTWAILKTDIPAWSVDKEALWSTYAVLIDSGTTLTDWILTTAQKEDYGAFFLKAWALNRDCAYRDFMANWIEINLNGPNRIGLMPRPSSIGLSFIASETGLYQVLNTTKFVNLTATIAINATEQGLCGYQTQFNYTAGYKARLVIELTFNDTISKTTLVSQSMPAEVISATKIIYSVETLLTGTKSNTFTCPETTAIAITAANLYWDYYGEKYLLASVAPAAGWATPA